jgi:anti-sigma factor RsiW
MKCDRAYLHICDNLDENLHSPRCREIKAHLRECPDCQAYLDSLKKTIALYKAMPEPSVPTRVHRELFKTLTALRRRTEGKTRHVARKT